MRKKILLILSAVLIAALLLSACGGSGVADTTASGGGNGSGGGGGQVALKLTGMVGHKMAWTEEEVRAMETMDAVSTNKNGEESTYTGVSINALLDLAGVQDGAAAVSFIADDGTGAEVSLKELQACADCIVSFRNQGGFSIVMPGFPGNLQVKGVVEIVVK